MTMTTTKPTKTLTVKAPLDYTAYLADTKPIDQLRILATLAEEQQRLERKVADSETALKAAKAELATVAEERLPEIMEDLGLQTFRTRSGLLITLKENLHASISKENEPAAFAWLDQNGFAKLIKRQFIVQFGKGEEKWAKKFANDLSKRKRQLEVDQKKGVHPQTLKAFCKEQLTEGKDLPVDLFGIHRQQYTKVEIPT